MPKLSSLSGIRVVKSFANGSIERNKFLTKTIVLCRAAKEYKSEVYFYEGMTVFTQIMPIAIVVFGGVAIVNRMLDLADLLTFLLYIGILIEPIKRFGNFTRLYQMGMAGFERFMEVLEVEPDIQDAPAAPDLPAVRLCGISECGFQIQGNE